MCNILEKYKRYNLNYNWIRGVLTIRKPIPVEEFLKLKMDIAMAGVELTNIIVEGR